MHKRNVTQLRVSQGIRACILYTFVSKQHEIISPLRRIAEIEIINRGVIYSLLCAPTTITHQTTAIYIHVNATIRLT